jgi:hypothetical protein
VKAVDVQKVDGAIVKLSERVLEASAQKIGKLPIVTAVVIVDLIEDFLAIKSGVLIPVPVVHGVAQAGKLVLFDGLAEGEVSLAPVSAEFDDKARLQGRNQIIRKGEMTGPAADVSRLVAARKEPGRR